MEEGRPPQPDSEKDKSLKKKKRGEASAPLGISVNEVAVDKTETPATENVSESMGSRISEALKRIFGGENDIEPGGKVDKSDEEIEIPGVEESELVAGETADSYSDQALPGSEQVTSAVVEPAKEQKEDASIWSRLRQDIPNPRPTDIKETSEPDDELPPITTGVIEQTVGQLQSHAETQVAPPETEAQELPVVESIQEVDERVEVSPGILGEVENTSAVDDIETQNVSTPNVLPRPHFSDERRRIERRIDNQTYKIKRELAKTSNELEKAIESARQAQENITIINESKPERANQTRPEVTEQTIKNRVEQPKFVGERPLSPPEIASRVVETSRANQEIADREIFTSADAPERVVERVMNAAEHNEAIERLYETRHEIKDDEAGKTGAVPIGAVVDEAVSSKVSDSLTAKLVNTTNLHHTLEQERHKIQDRSVMYETAMKGGLAVAGALIVFALLAYLLRG